MGSFSPRYFSTDMVMRRQNEDKNVELTSRYYLIFSQGKPESGKNGGNPQEGEHGDGRANS